MARPRTPRSGLRVIAGTAGGLRLTTPPGLGTRPITDRAKESLFGSLGPDVLEGARVLDLYAGSGAMAIEAFSRGADHATLVERDGKAVDVIRQNLATTRFADDAEVVRSEVAGHLRGRPPAEPFTLVFVDPPYEVPTADVEAVLRTLASGWAAPGARVVIRRRTTDGAPALPEGWSFTRERTFGDTLLLVAAVT